MACIQRIPDGEGFVGFGFIKCFNSNAGMDEYKVAYFHLVEQCR